MSKKYIDFINHIRLLFLLATLVFFVLEITGVVPYNTHLLLVSLYILIMMSLFALLSKTKLAFKIKKFDTPYLQWIILLIMLGVFVFRPAINPVIFTHLIIFIIVSLLLRGLTFLLGYFSK